jgi:hypothetical protein
MNQDRTIILGEGAMKNIMSLAGRSDLFSTAVILIALFSAFPALTAAQTGPNAVYNSSGSCFSSSKCTASPAFIDASVFAGSVTNPNFCSVLNYVLARVVQPNYSSGVVIDARAFPNSTPPTSMTCTGSPWGSGSSYVNVPSTILLPATGGGTNVAPIVIPSGWVLPANTHLIGVADGDVAISGSASYSGTTIQACKSGQSGCGASLTGTMLSMCSSACSGVSIENLSLDGQGDCVWD